MKTKRRRPMPKMDIETALAIVPDDLPDGAWMAMLGELTGGNAGDVAGMLAELSRGDAGDFSGMLAALSDAKTIGMAKK